jgi:hypothetical protein
MNAGRSGEQWDEGWLLKKACNVKAEHRLQEHLIEEHNAAYINEKEA